MKKRIFSTILIGILVFVSTLSIVWAVNYIDYTVNKTPGSDQFDFPGNYTPPELTIDGQALEEEWAATPVLATFSTVSVKVYRGDEALFVYFEVADTILLTQGNSNDDSVTRSDSIEFYIDTLNNGGRNPQSDDYQFNFGIHNKTRIMQGSGSNWGNWNGLIDYEVHLNGTLNDGIEPTDTGYSIEVMVPYRQINIQKEDTIGISLGRVNKSSLGDSAGVDWDWFGWTWGEKFREPQTIDNYVSLTADGTLYDRNDLPVPNTTLIGTVTNELTGLPVVGATITHQENPEMTTTTNSDGYYIFTNVNPELTYVFDVEHDEYFPSTITYTRDELRASNGSSVSKSVALIEIATAQMTTVTGQIKNIVNGFVDGATVSVAGTTISTTTALDGSFEIEQIPASNGVTLVISKAGYADETIVIPVEEVEMNSVTALGVTNLSLAYNSNMSFGGARGQNLFIINVTRTLTGVRFVLTTSTKFEGPEGAILYIQAGTTGVDKAVGLRFGGNETITFDKPNDAVWHRNDTSSIDYQVIQNSDPETGATLWIEIPYAYLFMDGKELDPFGISAGANTYEGGNIGWDGMGSPWGFVDPNNFGVYARYNHLNAVYQGANNNVKVTIAGQTVAGTVVTIGSTSVVANNQGSYSITIDRPSTDVTLTAKRDGYIWVEEVIAAADFVGAFNKEFDIELEEKLVTLSGSIVDVMSTPVEGATITVTVGETVIGTATTDAAGLWSLADVPTLNAVRVTASKDNYIDAYVDVSLSALNSTASVSIEAQEIILSQGTVEIIGAVANVLSPLEGVNVSVVGGASVQTAQDGTFEILDVALSNLVINISKDNYVSRQLTFNVADLENGEVIDLGIIDLGFRYASLGNLQDGNSSAKVTRGIEGFEFVFSTSAFALEDYFNIYVSTKATTETSDAGTYRFQLNGDGSIGITDYDLSLEAVKNETAPLGMSLSINHNGEAAEVVFILPYAFFGVKGLEWAITSDEVIGIALSRFVASSETTHGWNFVKGGQSVQDNDYVNPANPKDYVRLSYDNLLYNAQVNTTVDFDSYDFQFGLGHNGASLMRQEADHFLMNVTRDEEGLIFNIIGLSGLFADNEIILIYLDINNTASGGWANDYLYKIQGNSNVYGRAGAWWNSLNPSQNNLVDPSNYELSIDHSSGFSVISFKLYYTAVAGTGIADDATVGFALREAAQLEPTHPDHALYDPWHDFYYQADSEEPFSRWFNFVIGPSTQVDAANEDQFPRINGEGEIFRAPSNVA